MSTAASLSTTPIAERPPMVKIAAKGSYAEEILAKQRAAANKPKGGRRTRRRGARKSRRGKGKSRRGGRSKKCKCSLL